MDRIIEGGDDYVEANNDCGMYFVPEQLDFDVMVNRSREDNSALTTLSDSVVLRVGR